MNFFFFILFFFFHCFIGTNGDISGRADFDDFLSLSLSFRVQTIRPSIFSLFSFRIKKKKKKISERREVHSWCASNIFAVRKMFASYFSNTFRRDVPNFTVKVLHITRAGWSVHIYRHLYRHCTLFLRRCSACREYMGAKTRFWPHLFSLQLCCASTLPPTRGS